MFSGMPLEVNGEKFVIPALSLGLLRGGLIEKLKKHDELAKDVNGNFFELMLLRGEIILAAIKRNHPDMTEEKLGEMIDLGNIAMIWNTLLGSSGFKPLGEDQAATTGTNGT